MGLSVDEALKFYAADQITHGAKLIVGQHGGGYGILKEVAPERHETLIADSFLSWGWTDSCGDTEKVVPLGNLRSHKIRKRKHRVARSVSDTVLLLMNDVPIYGFGSSSQPIGDQWYDYFYENVKFVRALDLKVAARLSVRLYPHDYNRGQKELWLEQFNDISFADPNSPIRELIASAALVVLGYPGTDFATSLTSRTPTIAFWPKKLFDAREEARESLDALHSVNFLHYDPTAAARFVNKTRKLDHWWNSDPTLTARAHAAWEFSRHVSSKARAIRAAVS